MSKELIERLRADAESTDDIGLCADAADRIEELEQENKRLSDDHYFQACLTRDLMPYQERAIKAEQKCDALQADNARLREVLVKHVAPYLGHKEVYDEVLASIPAQSLARLRNRVLEECAKRAEAYTYMSQNFNALAEELRAMKEPE